jgi:diacylglycerol kinase family enzyme
VRRVIGADLCGRNPHARRHLRKDRLLDQLRARCAAEECRFGFDANAPAAFGFARAAGGDPLLDLCVADVDAETRCRELDLLAVDEEAERLLLGAAVCRRPRLWERPSFGLGLLLEVLERELELLARDLVSGNRCGGSFPFVATTECDDSDGGDDRAHDDGDDRDPPHASMISFPGLASSPPMSRAVLIVNPHASRVSESTLAEVEGELRTGFELAVARTERRGHAIELARGCGADDVFVYGGDGLVNEVLNGVGAATTVGVVPGGGTNVLARALGLPRDAVRAARVLLGARPRRVALGRANGRRFAFAAGIGLDAELVRRVDALGRSADGRRPGDLAFAWQAARLLALRRGRLEPALTIDGFGRAALLLVANTDPYSYAGRRPLRVAPEARFELGLDFVAPRRVRPATIPRLLAYAVRGRGQQAADDVLYGHDVDRLDVACDGPLPLQVDGEDLGDVEHVVFEAEPDAVSLLAP